MRAMMCLAVVAFAACGKKDAPVRAAESARGDVAARTDTGMAGMDHANMPGMGADTGRGATASAVDHANMAGMAGSKTTGTKTTPIAGMDHSKMPGMTAPRAPRGQAAPMDHANMPGMNMAQPSAAQRRRVGTAAAPGAMPAMDHANMPGMTMTTAPAMTVADAKLDTLIAALLRDPVVRQRIESDPTLRTRWDQAAKQTIVPARP